MIPIVTNSREAESPEAKAKWFGSLTPAERMALFCEVTDLVLAANPAILDVKNAQSAQGRVQVLRRA